MAPRSIARIKLLACCLLWLLSSAGAWIPEAANDLSSSTPSLVDSIDHDSLRLSIGTASQSEERPRNKARYSPTASYTNKPSSSVALLELFPSSQNSWKDLTQASNQLPQHEPLKKARYAQTSSYAKKISRSGAFPDLVPSWEDFRKDLTQASDQLPLLDEVRSAPWRSLSDPPNLDLSLGPHDSFHVPNKAVEVDPGDPSQTGGLSEQTLGPAPVTPNSPLLDVFPHLLGSKLLGDKMPQNSVEQRTIDEFMKPFQSLVAELIAHPITHKDSSRKRSQADVFTAAVESHHRPQLHINRILSSDGRCRPPSKLFKSFSNLIKHIIYFQSLFPIQIFRETGTPILDAKYIIDWLFKEVFGPQKDFPILGLVKKNPSRDKDYQFSALERNLIAYLRSWDLSERTGAVALFIIQSCYESTHPKEWGELLNYVRSHRMSVDVEILRSKVTMPYSQKEQFNSKPFPSVAHERPAYVIEDFRWPSASSRLAELRMISVASCWIRSQSKRADIMKMVQEFQANISGKQNEFARIPMFGVSRINGVPAGSILGTKGKVLIKPLHPCGEPLVKQLIDTKLEKLITSVMLYHGALMELLKPAEGSNTPSLVECLTWLEKTISERNQDSLPVYGIVEQRAAPFTSEDFGKVQTYLLKFFSYREKRNNPLYELTLLGYWYKRFHPQFWKNYCKSEVEFQELIFRLH